MPATRSTPFARRRNAGFTLIEVMITVAIIAILAAIAVPQYRDYVLRGQLVNATTGLSQLRANMERFFQDNRTYVTTGAFISPCTAPPAQGTFVLSCVAVANPPSFVLTATGSGPTAGFTYTVDQTNARATTTVPAGIGWTICANDWVTKKGGC